ncbi:MAG TPA: hypothetical protein VIM11_14470 [Tepidisphaeraceae bacterium]|jgi:hypothetical protein
MASTTELRDLIAAIKDGQLSVTDVKDLLDHPSALVRANAIIALPARVSDVDELVTDLTLAASRPQNTAYLIGTTSVADVAIGELIRTGSQKAVAAARALVQTWADSRRTDLNRYLKSEHMSVI